MSTTIQDHPALVLFCELLATPAPSGREEQLSQIIRGRLDGLGYSHRSDGAGNVIVDVEGRDPEAPLVCLAAHTDEIGMVVTRIESDGSLRVDRSGGLFPWKIGEGPVEILGDQESITGVLSMGSTHTPLAEERTITWKDVRIITGLTQDELKAVGVRPGSTAVPTRERRGPVFLGPGYDPLVGAWTFDDRMGVVALLRLLETIRQEAIVPAHPTMIAFTVHEEGGCHGAKVLAHRECPYVFVAVDGCPMPPDSPLQLDGRPGVWSKDRVTHFDQRLVTDLCSLSADAGVELQVAVFDGAASDASLVYSVGAAERVAHIGHVRENSHGYEVARLSVFDNLLTALVAFVKGWKG
ncbi:MAG TPA: M20/M25/M40 family metallo-hydrolase [Phycisphaerae bacterium]|nr:M20/M25/M40 family metallo-hydrolase [Phycisphaerae bacterium]